MAGLLNKQPPGGQPQQDLPAAAPGQDPGADPTAGGEEGNVSPEEQAEYDTFVTRGMEVMYSEQVMPQLLESIKANGDPVEGLANALVMLVVRVEDAAADNQAEVSGDVKFQGATELMEQMVELVEAAGIHEYSEDDMETALYRALDLYREKRQQDGTLPVEELQEDMSELQQADQEGRLDEMVPGAKEYAQRKGGQAAQEQGPGMGRG